MIKFISICVLFPLTVLAKDITYKVNDKEYEGYIINKGNKAPLVFMIHDWDGITDYEKKRSNMLAKLGYSVFVADLYGKGVRPTEVSEKKKMTSSLYENRKLMRELMDGAFDTAQKQNLNTKNALSLGYCFGGTAILEFARSGKALKGHASFHGGLTTPEGQNYKKVNGSIIIFHGTADTAVSMQEFADLAVELENNKVSHEMLTYSGATHAFSVFGSPRYRKEADEKSWARFTAFLAEKLNE